VDGWTDGWAIERGREVEAGMGITREMRWRGKSKEDGAGDDKGEE
jgi:hypothetical protein